MRLKHTLLLILFVPFFMQSQTTGQDSVVAASASKKEKGNYALPKAENDHEANMSTPVLKKASVLYRDRAYSEAIPFYEKALQGDSTNEDVLVRLGDCYRLTNNTQGKLMCYGRLIRTGKAKPIHELYYGQALIEDGQSEAAKPYFEKYGADSRGKNLASSFGKQKSYTRNADAYKVTLASFNSPQNDMCAVKYYNATVFATSRPNSKWIAHRQGWTNTDYLNVYATEKDQKGLEKKPVLFLKDLNTKFNDGPICFNKDFYLIYYTTNNARKEERARDGSFKLRILEGELDENGLVMVKLPAFNNKEYNYAHPALSSDGKTIYFSSDLDGGMGGMDIYRSEKDSTGTWGPAINLGPLVNTAGAEVFPFMASNGSLFFSSNGQDGMGGLDIYEVTLKNKQPHRLYNMGEPVNSRYDDFGIYLVDDRKSGYISSNRKAGGMDDDIYELEVLREIRRGKDVLIVTKDKATGEPMANTKLLLDKDTVFTNEKGEYITLLDEDGTLKIKTLKEDYFELSDSVAARSTTNDAFVKEFLLEKNPKLFLRALITDAKTHELLEGVNIKVTDINTGSEIDRFTTTADGDYFKFLFNNRVGDKLAYLIKLEKNGYLQRSLVFTHTIDKPGEVNMNQIVNMSLGKVELGMDLGKLIDLKPIYFDMGKAKIRPDAAEELDKIVEVMNDYPNMFIELGSHTDCRSSAASNMKLSNDRAKASVAYIVSKGINKMRITAKGYGETRLLNNCACEGKENSSCPEEEHAKNRRTEFLITRLN